MLAGGIGTLIAYMIQKKRGEMIFRHFVLIPIFSLVLGVLFLSYAVYRLSVFKTSTADGSDDATIVTAYYDDDYNITMSGKRYVEFGYLSSQTAQSDMPIANLKETEFPPNVFNKGIENSYDETPLYSVSNGAKSDMITDGDTIYCEQSQLEQAKAYYNDLENYVFHAANEEDWYDKTTNELPIIQIDGKALSSMSALKSGTVMELQRVTPDQKIVYLVPVSRDGVIEKYYELLNQNGRLFLAYSETYEYDEAVYVCYKLPDTLNAYLLDVLFKALKI